MDFRRLEAFCRVFELRSFSKAGEELYLSQPTISAHVAALERELGIRLFDRLGRSILPTSAGEALYKHARAAFSALDTAKAEMQLLQDTVAGELIVGGSTIPAHYLMPGYFAEFLQRYPEVTVHLKVGDSAEIVGMVGRGELVLGLVGAEIEHPDLAYTPVAKDDLIVVAAPSLLGDNDVAGLDDLLGLPWILRESGSGTRLAMEKSLGAAGRDIRSVRKAMEVDSTQAVLQCVSAGIGVSILSRPAAQAALDRNELKELDIPELTFRRRFFLVHHKRRHFFPAAFYFIEFIKEKAKSLVTTDD